MPIDPDALEMLGRKSGVHLDTDGVFHFRGEPVANARVQALFHKHLRVAADGEVIIQLGDTWSYVPCEGVAHFVAHLECVKGVVSGRCLGGELATLSSVVFAWGPDARIYVWCDQWDGVAKLLRKAHQSLCGQLEVDAGVAYLATQEGTVKMSTLAAAPAPSDAPPASG